MIHQDIDPQDRLTRLVKTKIGSKYLGLHGQTHPKVEEPNFPCPPYQLDIRLDIPALADKPSIDKPHRIHLLAQMDNGTLLLVSRFLQVQFLLQSHLYPIIAKIEQL